MTNVETDLL